MASLYATQITGTIKKNKVIWDLKIDDSIAREGIRQQNVLENNVIQTEYSGNIYINTNNNIIINPNNKCSIVYISVQGPPGLPIYINESSKIYRLGHTGIFESGTYNNNPIKKLQINGSYGDDNNALETTNFYIYNTIIIDVIYKINMSSIE